MINIPLKRIFWMHANIKNNVKIKNKISLDLYKILEYSFKEFLKLRLLTINIFLSIKIYYLKRMKYTNLIAKLAIKFINYK